MAYTTCELQWLFFLFTNLSHPFAQPIPLFYDNQSALDIVENLPFNERTKYIKIDCHLIR